MTPPLLLAYGVFFLLGFTLFALIYAAMGAFVSRPDDLQTLSLPLSLVAMAGYLSAILALGSGGSSGITRLLSFLPPFSPFVMLARVLVGSVQPWELVLSIGLLIGADRRRRRRRDPHVRSRRPAVRPAARHPGIHRRRAERLTTAPGSGTPQASSSRGNRLSKARTGAVADALAAGSAGAAASSAAVTAPARAGMNRHSRLRVPGR